MPRNKYDHEHLMTLTKNQDKDYGMCAPPMDAQVALNELKRYFLGEDWYFVNPLHGEQGNTEIVCAIERQYKGAKIKKRGGCQ